MACGISWLCKEAEWPFLNMVLQGSCSRCRRHCLELRCQMTKKPDVSRGNRFASEIIRVRHEFSQAATKEESGAFLLPTTINHWCCWTVGTRELSGWRPDRDYLLNLFEWRSDQHESCSFSDLSPTMQYVIIRLYMSILYFIILIYEYIWYADTRCTSAVLRSDTVTAPRFCPERATSLLWRCPVARLGKWGKWWFGGHGHSMASFCTGAFDSWRLLVHYREGSVGIDNIDSLILSLFFSRSIWLLMITLDLGWFTIDLPGSYCSMIWVREQCCKLLLFALVSSCYRSIIPAILFICLQYQGNLPEIGTWNSSFDPYIP